MVCLANLSTIESIILHFSSYNVRKKVPTCFLYELRCILFNILLTDLLLRKILRFYKLCAVKDILERSGFDKVVKANKILVGLIEHGLVGVRDIFVTFYITDRCFYDAGEISVIW